MSILTELKKMTDPQIKYKLTLTYFFYKMFHFKLYTISMLN